MEIRIRETGAVVFDGEFRAMFPNTSLPERLTADVLDGLGADPVLEGPQATPTRYQIAFRDGVEESGGQWFTKYSVADMADEAAAAVDAAQATAVRDDRNRRLENSDWTQVADAPVDKAAWATYRQQLRDVTDQVGFPWDVVWPETP